MTDEATELVDKWVADKKPSFPIVIVKPGDYDAAMGVTGYPTHAVIDPKGNLITGDAAEGSLGKALKAAKPGSMWPKKLEKPATMIKAANWSGAWAELDGLGKDTGLDEREKELVLRFSKHVEATAADALKAARDDFKNDLVFSAVKKIEGIATAKTPLPSTEDAAKLMTEMKALPTFDAELKAGEAFLAAKAKEDAQEYLDAFNGYKDTAKKFEVTKVAGAAKKNAQALLDKGMIGYQPVCPKCMAAKKACEKHAKPVKL